LATHRAISRTVGLGASLLVALGAQAGVALNATRVGATDVAALAKFPEAAFGPKQVNRHRDARLDDSVASAKVNPAA
jgi:hypothetical protein